VAVELLSATLSGARLLARLAYLCTSACEALFAQVAVSFFVPFCLSTAAICSRLRVAASALLPAYSTTYATFLSIAAALPLRRLGRTTTGQELPEMMIVVWRDGLPVIQDGEFGSGGGFVALAEEKSRELNVVPCIALLKREAYAGVFCKWERMHNVLPTPESRLACRLQGLHPERMTRLHDTITRLAAYWTEQNDTLFQAEESNIQCYMPKESCN
jgi:hypothetical protein